MGGDYTRFTFNPVKGFSGVHKQQGRVSLDSEFNELEEILDRRDRAEMYDTVGQAVVPMTTPNGFEIAVNGAGKLTIGVGRAYVDGILAECFGDMSDTAKTVRDDRIGGVTGPGPVAYDQQPFRYDSPVLPFPALSGPVNVVYLDVWQREVTVFEDPTLREVALNGPDTATRVQTAWQVKSIPDPDATDCVTPTPAWTRLTAASTARLTAQAVPAPPAPGPCVINPAGGYTGLENRLYRVEVHKAGTLGGAGGTTRAQFKWSRDNASLAAKVLSITKISASESVITVASTGRDSWMRFEHGDHVELLDDWVEYAMRERGKGGELVGILSVNHTTGEIHVDADLSGFAVAPARHPRIRRWDIATPSEPLVRDVSNGTAIPLEEGISVTFGASDADTLHAGDYWVFAARTADGTIDPLVSAPPRGILHHFARLARVAAGPPPSVLTPCRVFWPPKAAAMEGCCTAVVRPGEDIQKAIDSLAGKGGCVCLKAGVHTITAPLKIAQSNLTLHAEAPWVTVRMPNGGPLMLDIAAKTLNVSVEGIMFEAAAGTTADPIIRLYDVYRGHIVGCGLRILGEGKIQSAGIGMIGCQACAVETTSFENLARGIVAQSSREIRIVGNSLGGSEARVREMLKKLQSGSVPLLTLLGTSAAISLEGVDHSRVAENEVHDAIVGVLAVQSPGTTVVANRITQAIAGVVLAAADECEARDNIVSADFGEGAAQGTNGVILLGTTRAVASSNAIALCDTGILLAVNTAARVQDNDVDECRTGIVSILDLDLRLQSNTVQDAAQNGIVTAFALHEVSLAGDRTLRCGSRPPAGSPAVGIGVLGTIGLATVEGCHVVDTGEAASEAKPFAGPRFGVSVWFAIGARVRGCTVASKALAGSPDTASRGVLIATFGGAQMKELLREAAHPFLIHGDATDNLVEQSAVVLVQVETGLERDGEVVFATNRCVNLVGEDPGKPAVALKGTNLVVTGNRIQSSSKTPSLQLSASGHIAAVGNMSTGGATLVSGTLTPPVYTSANVNA